MRRIVKIVWKTIRNFAMGKRLVKQLEMRGYKNAQITNRFSIHRGKKGLIVLAFRGKKPTPKGFRTSRVKF